MHIVAIIPARYNSTRLRGKPLELISDKPMIWWVYNKIKSIDSIDEIYVATDDQRIVDVCNQHSIRNIMTKASHPTAANRLFEVSERVKADFYLQINGDEPLIDADVVKAIIPTVVPQDVEYGINLITKTKNPAQVMDSSNIKVVFDNEYNALYMSRNPIPYPFKSVEYQYYKHLGIIGYNKKMLDFYNESVPGYLEKIEGIDTMRFIDYNKQLKFVEVDSYESLSVDTEQDLEIVRKIMFERGEVNEKY